jgi:hypothetical protein
MQQILAQIPFQVRIPMKVGPQVYLSNTMGLTILFLNPAQSSSHGDPFLSEPLPNQLFPKTEISYQSSAPTMQNNEGDRVYAYFKTMGRK